MKGKEKCKALKEIREQIAKENDIPFAVSQCTHQGDCRGTCPRCESELKYLERELAIRQGLGKAIAVVGISAGVCTSLTACSPINTVKNFIERFENDGNEELAGRYELFGDIALPPDREVYDEDDIQGGLEEYDPQETIVPDTDDLLGNIPLY